MSEPRIITNVKTPLCEIAIREEFGWRRSHADGVTLWTKGYGRIERGDELAARLASWKGGWSPASIERLLLDLDGHFAVAALGPGWAFAAVDRVRSIPVAFSRDASGWVIDDQADRLRRRLGLGPSDTDPDAALALAMSGYTIDRATLYPAVRQLGPGEMVLFRPGKEPERRRYYCYRPWRADKPAYDPARARKAFCEMTLSLVDAMMRSLGDRPLAVPLSAGRDSRLIVSAAVHLGHRNIRTFSYGRPGNHEARAAGAIAERLGLPWRFVPSSVASMRRYFASSMHGEYLDFCDALQSVPFIQDLPHIAALKDDGYIPDDAVIANGNSGDYISGAHVIPEMQSVPKGLGEEARVDRILNALSQKHFALWRNLRTPDNLARVRQMLAISIAAADARPGAPEDDYGIYEYAEFQDRQCKYVITGQRIYEFLGHDWRLPLWDREYLDFFEGIPLEGKVGQRLYAEALEEANWGGVWQGMPINAKTIRPRWIIPLRWIAKAAHVPLGRDAWHRFERRYFQYWMDSTGHSAVVPYRRAASDHRGQRTFVSWLSEQYLQRHGVAGRVF